MQLIFSYRVHCFIANYRNSTFAEHKGQTLKKKFHKHFFDMNFLNALIKCKNIKQLRIKLEMKCGKNVMCKTFNSFDSVYFSQTNVIYI